MMGDEKKIIEKDKRHYSICKENGTHVNESCHHVIMLKKMTKVKGGKGKHTSICHIYQTIQVSDLYAIDMPHTYSMEHISMRQKRKKEKKKKRDNCIHMIHISWHTHQCVKKGNTSALTSWHIIFQ